MILVSGINLKRTDTTLDLSQKAETQRSFRTSRCQRGYHKLCVQFLSTVRFERSSKRIRARRWRIEGRSRCAIGARYVRLVDRSLRTVEEDNSPASMAHRGPVPFRNRRKSDGDIETVRRVVCAQLRLYTFAQTCIRKTRTCK